jgi:hypothetical protein
MDSHGLNRKQSFEISRRTPRDTTITLQFIVIFITIGPIFSTGFWIFMRTTLPPYSAATATRAITSPGTRVSETAIEFSCDSL